MKKYIYRKNIYDKKYNKFKKKKIQKNVLSIKKILSLSELKIT